MEMIHCNVLCKCTFCYFISMYYPFCFIFNLILQDEKTITEKMSGAVVFFKNKLYFILKLIILFKLFKKLKIYLIILGFILKIDEKVTFIIKNLYVTLFLTSKTGYYIKK